jgi:hypothetical protein
MIPFLLYTIFFILGSVSFVTVMWVSIQPGQWLDSLFGWQRVLNRIGMRSGPFNELVYKAFGGCMFCFCHWMSFLCFWTYALFMTQNVGWFSGSHIVWVGLMNVTWFLCFDFISTVISFLTVSKILGYGKQ